MNAHPVHEDRLLRNRAYRGLYGPAKKLFDAMRPGDRLRKQCTLLRPNGTKLQNERWWVELTKSRSCNPKAARQLAESGALLPAGDGLLDDASAQTFEKVADPPWVTASWEPSRVKPGNERVDVTKGTITFRLVVFPAKRGGGYGYGVIAPDGMPTWAMRTFANIDEARTAAFGHLEHIGGG